MTQIPGDHMISFACDAVLERGKITLIYRPKSSILKHDLKTYVPSTRSLIVT